MGIVVCTDIFGVTTELKRFLDEIGIKEHCEILDPHDGVHDGFDSEELAYLGFSNRGGIEAYISLISDALDTLSTRPTHIIGFSAGAAAAYVALNRADTDIDCKLFGFYPGQIRKYLDIENTTRCVFVFPEQESHFNQDEVCDILAKMSLIEQQRTPFAHGFMNQRSLGFNSEGYAKYVQVLKAWLSSGL